MVRLTQLPCEGYMPAAMSMEMWYHGRLGIGKGFRIHGQNIAGADGVGRNKGSDTLNKDECNGFLGGKFIYASDPTAGLESEGDL